MLIEILAKPALKFINNQCQNDNVISETLSPHIDKLLVICINGLPIKIALSWTTEGFTLQSASDGLTEVADARIVTDLTHLSSMLFSSNDSPNMQELTLFGDMDFIQDFQKAWKQWAFDATTPLSKIIGELPAHSLVARIKRLINYKKQQARNMGKMTRDFLQHESNTLAATPAIQTWYDEIDSIQMQTDRLQARITRLEGKIHD